MDGKTVVEPKPQETQADSESASQKETDEAHTTDDQELETQEILEEADNDNEEDELSNPFAAPELPPEPTSDEFRPSLEIVIIPRIVENRYEDEEVEAICEQEEENVEDKHQHFFMDQLGSERPRWTKPWFSMAAMIAFMVDMSSLTSFPNNVAKQGGIAYVIAYITVVALFAYPTVYLEALIGQYFQTGMIGIWGLTPIGRGLGTGFFYLCFLLISILPMNTLYAILYMNEAVNSIHSGTIPWLECTNEWNTCHCIGTRDKMCLDLKEDPSYENSTLEYSPATEFFVGKVLLMWKTQYSDPLAIRDITEAGNWNTSYGFHNEKEGLGYLIPTSCLILLSIFALIMLLTLTDMKYLGYVLSFSAFAPLGVLVLMFCRAVTLDGAYGGLKKYMLSEPTKIFDPSIWYVAIESAFFSVGTGSGVLIVVSSFNPLNHDAKRDAYVSVIVDTLMGILASVVSFMFVGHLYTDHHQDVPDDFPGGQTFVYVAQAESFTSVSGSSFFACLYYFMIVVFTLDTQVVTLHSLSFSLFEEFKRKYPNQESSRKLFLFTIWGFAFAITLVCATRGGYWLFSFMASYFFNLTAILFMLLELMVLCWIWGIEEVCIAVETISGKRPSLFLRISWKYTTPIVCLGIFLWSNTTREYKPIVVFGQMAPLRTVKMGFLFQWISIVLLLVYGIYTCCRFRKKGKTCLEVFLLLFSPEYEHQEILEDVRNAKRLKWKHYSFIMFEDEKFNINIKEKFQKAFQSVKNTASKVKNLGKKAPPPEPTPSMVAKEKRKKKKKKEREEIEDLDNTAWDLWDKAKVKKEKSDVSEETMGEVQSTRRSRQRASKKSISFTSRSLGPRRKQIVPATKKKIKSSKGPNKMNTSSSSLASGVNSSSTSKRTDSLVSNSTSGVTLDSSSASILSEKSAGLPKKKGKKGKVLPGRKNKVKPVDSSDSWRSESISSLT